MPTAELSHAVYEQLSPLTDVVMYSLRPGRADNPPGATRLEVWPMGRADVEGLLSRVRAHLARVPGPARNWIVTAHARVPRALRLVDH